MAKQTLEQLPADKVEISDGRVSCMIPSWYTERMRQGVLARLNAHRAALESEKEKRISGSGRLRAYQQPTKTQESFSLADAHARQYERIRNRY